jgi:hypothetical protein
MNERRQAHITYFPERVEYWKGLKRDYWAARMLAAVLGCSLRATGLSRCGSLHAAPVLSQEWSLSYHLPPGTELQAAPLSWRQNQRPGCCLNLPGPMPGE